MRNLVALDLQPVALSPAPRCRACTRAPPGACAVRIGSMGLQEGDGAPLRVLSRLHFSSSIASLFHLLGLRH